MPLSFQACASYLQMLPGHLNNVPRPRGGGNGGKGSDDWTLDTWGRRVPTTAKESLASMLLDKIFLK